MLIAQALMGGLDDRHVRSGLRALHHLEGALYFAWVAGRAANSVEIARFSVESQRPSTFIDYATLAPFAMDGLGAALAMEDRNSGICL